jgi:hypothetical protein
MAFGAAQSDNELFSFIWICIVARQTWNHLRQSAKAPLAVLTSATSCRFAKSAM